MFVYQCTQTRALNLSTAISFKWVHNNLISSLEVYYTLDLGLKQSYVVFHQLSKCYIDGLVLALIAHQTQSC